jgi:hypothetical protein
MWSPKRTKRGKPKRYFLDQELGDLSPAAIRDRVSTAAAAHLLWNIMFEPGRNAADIPQIRKSITEKEAWEIALSTQGWHYGAFELYMHELIDAQFLHQDKLETTRSTWTPGREMNGNVRCKSRTCASSREA